MSRLIDADAVLDWANIAWNNNELSNEKWKWISEVLNTFPTEADVKAARWLWVKTIIDNGKNPYSLYKCSNCGGTVGKEWNYCPHCGAIMEEGENETY